MDRELRYEAAGEDARPLIFSPHVDLARLAEPSIIDAF
jgi:hypothetical protein